MKKWKVFILLLIICFSLTGCWNYREIDSLSIVAGVGIGRDQESGEFILYIEIVQPSGNAKEQTSESKIVESRGETVFDAARNAIDTSGKRLFWDHAQIVIVSEDIAREGILDVLDWFYRDAEPRLTIHFLTAQNAMVEDILNSDGITNTIRSFEINEKLKNADSIEKYTKGELYKIVEMLNFDVPFAYMPSITIEKQDDTEVSEICGTAIFKGDKLQGFLDLEETKYFLYVINEINGGLLTSNYIQDNQDANISLEVFNSKTMVKPVYSDEMITMKIHIETEVAIGESGPYVNFTDESALNVLKMDMQEFLLQNIVRVIKKVQSEFDTDIFGFGQIIYQDMPDVWNKYKNNWDTEFKRLAFDISSEIMIRDTGHAGKSLDGVE